MQHPELDLLRKEYDLKFEHDFKVCADQLARWIDVIGPIPRSCTLMHNYRSLSKTQKKIILTLLEKHYKCPLTKTIHRTEFDEDSYTTDYTDIEFDLRTTDELQKEIQRLQELVMQRQI